MLYPSGGAFVTALQEGQQAVATVTSTDDLVVVVDSIRARLDPAGITPRIRIQDDRNLVISARPPELPDGCVDGHSPSRVGCEIGTEWP